MNKSLQEEVICKFLISSEDKIFLINHENMKSLPTILCNSYPVENELIQKELSDKFGILANGINLIKMLKVKTKLLVFLECEEWSFSFDPKTSLAEKIFEETSFAEKEQLVTPVLGNWFDKQEIQDFIEQGLIDQYSSELLQGSQDEVIAI